MTAPWPPSLHLQVYLKTAKQDAGQQSTREMQPKSRRAESRDGEQRGGSTVPGKGKTWVNLALIAFPSVSIIADTPRTTVPRRRKQV